MNNYNVLVILPTSCPLSSNESRVRLAAGPSYCESEMPTGMDDQPSTHTHLVYLIHLIGQYLTRAFTLEMILFWLKNVHA